MASAVVGIDLGNYKTVIAVARNRGVDIILNEVSNRSTPSLVGFGPKCRYIGEDAKNQESRNFKNTVSSLKRLIGCSAKDPMAGIEQEYNIPRFVEIQDKVGVVVNAFRENNEYSWVQILAMFFSKIKQIAEADLKQQKVHDVVISCPGWMKDNQRRAMIEAAQIAGLNPLSLINDDTAAALSYGITKTNYSEDNEAHNVCFCDFGHSDFSVSVVSFKKEGLAIKGRAYDANLGGRDIDMMLARFFAEEFKKSHNLDVFSNPKALTRLMPNVEKLKKVLSANSTGMLTVENIMNDLDISISFTREKLEQLIQPLLDRIIAPIEAALRESGMSQADIHAIEVIGGSIRVPCVKNKIANFFSKSLSYSLNQDEAIARGCAFACAILSPAFRVRDYTVHDITDTPVMFEWEKVPEFDDEDTSMVVFSKKNVIPSTKALSFYRKEDFELRSYMVLSESQKVMIGKYKIVGVEPTPEGDTSLVKVKIRLNSSGILCVEQASLIEDYEVEEPIPEEDGTAKEGAKDSDKSGEPVKTRKVRKTRVKKHLVIEQNLVSALPSDVLRQYQTLEHQYIETDKLVMETEEKKNQLEAFVYEVRDDLNGGKYVPYASEAEKANLMALLTDIENWIYEDGEDATKAEYQDKILEIKTMLSPVSQKYQEVIQKQREEAERKAREAEEARLAAEAKAKAAEAQEEGTGGAAPPPPPQVDDDSEMQD